MQSRGCDLQAICDLNATEFECVELYKIGSGKNKLNTATYETDEKYIIHPSSGYTESKVAYGAIPVADETAIIPLYQFTDAVVPE